MNLQSKLKRIEKGMQELNKPTKEQEVCTYLNSMWAFFSGEGTEESMLQNYEKVKDNVPPLH